MYLKYDPLIALTRDAYLAASCNDDVGINGNSPLIVGEWTLSPATSVQASAEFDVTDNAAWYGLWWAAQVMAYEKQEGWIFWSWKADHIGGLDDWRWSYQGTFVLSHSHLVRSTEEYEANCAMTQRLLRRV